MRNASPKAKKETYQNKLNALLEAYHEQWTAFVESDKFFLSKKERQVMAYLLTYNSIKLTAKDLGFSESYTRSIIRKILRRLERNNKYYDEFRAEQSLEQQLGIPKQTNLRERFLEMHLFGHDLPLEDVHLLISAECHCMNDVINNFSKEKLLRLKGYGKVKLDRLEAVLIENNCIHLLKEA